MKNVQGYARALVVSVILLATAAAAGDAATAMDSGYLSSILDTGYESAANIVARSTALFKHYKLPALSYGVDTYKLTFVSRDFDGTPATITALLYVPRLEQAAQLPVLVFGAGTTGIGDACAPSLEPSEGRHFGDYRDNMLAYAAMGIITILPDYLGFDDPTRPQRYFSRLAEGHVMLDAARAVRHFYDVAGNAARPLDKVFVAGYSQGGHAAFSAADLWQSYAPDVPLAGIIGFGATTDVEALLREGPAYGPLIFYTYSVMYGFQDVNPREYLTEQFARTLEQDVTTLCIDKFQTYYSYDSARVYAPPFRVALYRGDLGRVYTSLSRRLEENRAGLGGHGLPALIIQGAKDFIVTSATQKKFVDALRALASPVTYADLPGAAHKDVRQAGFRMSVDWIDIISRGDPPPEE
jgi:pimeloyl-ACP methyl ester carboxylesterase